MGTSGLIGQQLGNEAAERGIEGHAAASRVGEQHSSAGVEVAAEGLEIFLGERERGAPVNVDQRIVNQAGIASEQVFLGDHDVEVEWGPAKGIHQVWDRLAGDVPVASMHELGDLDRAALGRLGLEAVQLRAG